MNGSIRVTVATIALSMGVNFPDIRFVVMWGPPRSILDFHQEAGRVLPMLNDQMIKENNDKLLIFLLFQLERFYNFPSHF
jgi:superfamily II DNA or RNA helicase